MDGARFGDGRRYGALAPFVLAVAALVAALGLLGPATAAAAPPAYFPRAPTATQIARELTLSQAAQAGLVKLTAKGGYQGDVVQFELDGKKKVKAPITVSVRVEMTVPARISPEKRALIAKEVPFWGQQTEKELNRIPHTRPGGDPIRFEVEFRYREPEAPPTPDWHQVKVFSPKVDTPNDPDKRSEVDPILPPNGPATAGNWAFGDLHPEIMAHETLHLVGLGDRYVDVYEYKGKKIPLPETGMAPKDLAKFLSERKPPIPPPPAGGVNSLDTPGTSPCDVMGSGADRPCRRLSNRDIKWLEQSAGVLVRAKPGESLLNKNPKLQNFGVGFESIVFSAPGSTTVAPGVAAYCIDHAREVPFENGFDVGPPLAQVPGYEGAARLLALNGARQTDLGETVSGMQAAVWNAADGTPLESLGSGGPSRELMAAAGVAEGNVDQPSIADPNAGSPFTGAVDAAGAVLPAIATTPAAAQEPIRIYTASLLPKRFEAGGMLRGDLLLGVGGAILSEKIRVQAKQGKVWKTKRTVTRTRPDSGTAPLALALGRLGPGKYRVLIEVAALSGETVKRAAPFAVRG